MNHEEYLELIKENPRITLSGFRIGRRGCPKGIFLIANTLEDEMLQRCYPLFGRCCDYLQSRNRLTRGLHLSDLNMSFENWLWQPPFARPEIPLGVVVLAAIYVGYDVRKVRGSTDARIVKGGAYN
jgi:hypothetical protein